MKTAHWRSAHRLLPLAAVAILVGFTAQPFHFALDKSLPEADSAGPSPEMVQLWFTQVPQDETTTIRVIDGNGDAVETGEVVQDGDDGKLQSIAIGQPLAPGSYTVAWRAMAADGHVVRDDFAFSVIAESDR